MQYLPTLNPLVGDSWLQSFSNQPTKKWYNVKKHEEKDLKFSYVDNKKNEYVIVIPKTRVMEVAENVCNLFAQVYVNMEMVHIVMLMVTYPNITRYHDFPSIVEYGSLDKVYPETQTGTYKCSSRTIQNCARITSYMLSTIDSYVDKFNKIEDEIKSDQQIIRTKERTFLERKSNMEKEAQKLLDTSQKNLKELIDFADACLRESVQIDEKKISDMAQLKRITKEFDEKQAELAKHKELEKAEMEAFKRKEEEKAKLDLFTENLLKSIEDMEKELNSVLKN